MGKRKNAKRHGQQMQCLTMPFCVKKGCGTLTTVFPSGGGSSGFGSSGSDSPGFGSSGVGSSEFGSSGFDSLGFDSSESDPSGVWFVGGSICKRGSEQSDFSAIIPRAGKRFSRGGRRRRGLLPRGCRRGGWVPWRRRAP